MDIDEERTRTALTLGAVVTTLQRRMEELRYVTERARESLTPRELALRKSDLARLSRALVCCAEELEALTTEIIPPSNRMN